MGDVVSLPRAKRAHDKKVRRRLQAFAGLVESAAQLDVLLDQDLKLSGSPQLREEVKRMIIALNPKLREV